MAKKAKFQIKNIFFLSGPLALVSFLLMDVLAGLNFPGYIWVSDTIKKYFACDSNSLVIADVFLVLFGILAIFCGFCLFKYLKSKGVNKLLKVGIVLFCIMIIVSIVSMCGMATSPVENQNKIVELSKTVMKTETVEATDDQPESTKEVPDEEANKKNQEELIQFTSEHPDAIFNAVTSSVATLLALISYLLIFIGAIKKKGHLAIGCFSLICFIFVMFGSFVSTSLDPNMFGVFSRFAVYADPLFVALSGSYIFITNKE